MKKLTKQNDLLEAMDLRRDRSKTKRGASHERNPAGSKIARAASRRMWSGRVRMPA